MIDRTKLENEDKSAMANIDKKIKELKALKAQLTESKGLTISSDKQVDKGIADLNDYLNELNVNIVINKVDELDKLLDILNDLEVSKEVLVEIGCMVRSIKENYDKLNNGLSTHHDLFIKSSQYKVKEADADQEVTINFDNINNKSNNIDNDVERVVDVHPASEELVDKAKAFKDFDVEDKYVIKSGESLYDVVKRSYEMQDFSLYKDEFLAVCRKVYLDNQDVIDAAIVLNNLDKEELLKSNKLFTDKFALNGISIKLPDVIEYDSLVYKGRSR